MALSLLLILVASVLVKSTQIAWKFTLATKKNESWASLYNHDSEPLTIMHRVTCPRKRKTRAELRVAGELN